MLTAPPTSSLAALSLAFSRGDTSTLHDRQLIGDGEIPILVDGLTARMGREHLLKFSFERGRLLKSCRWIESRKG